MPSIDIYDRTLYIFDRAANTIKQIIFKWDGRTYRTSGTETKSITLPEEIQIKPDPSSSEANRQQLAQNICQQFQQDKQMSADSSQKITDFIVKEVQSMTRVNQN